MSIYYRVSLSWCNASPPNRTPAKTYTPKRMHCNGRNTDGLQPRAGDDACARTMAAHAAARIVPASHANTHGDHARRSVGWRSARIRTAGDGERRHTATNRATGALLPRQTDSTARGAVPPNAGQQHAARRTFSTTPCTCTRSHRGTAQPQCAPRVCLSQAPPRKPDEHEAWFSPVTLLVAFLCWVSRLSLASYRAC